MDGMTQDQWIEHLLDAAPFLKSDSLEEYQNEFCKPTAVVTKPKRRRGSPNQVLETSSLPPCRNPKGECGLGTTIEDVREGSVVCIQCGLIQALSIFENATTSAIFHSGVSRIVVHHYSRIVHWAENIASLQGETKLTITESELTTLRTFCLAEESRIGVGVRAVREALHRKVIPYRFLRHANTLAFTLWPDKVKLPSLSDQDVRAVLQRLRRYEDVWQREISGKSRFKRKNFPAFRFMWPVIVEDLGLTHLQDMVSPLVVPRCIANLIGLVCYMREIIDK